MPPVIFLFLSIRRLYFIQFLREIYIEKVLQKLFGVLFFGRPCCSNGAKIYLDAALLPKIFFFNWDCLHTNAEEPLQGMELQEKEAQKE